MKAPKPKVEVRSNTGRNYRRAGAVWNAEWAELDEKAFTRAQLDEIAKDPHLEVRIDGKRARKTADGRITVDPKDAAESAASRDEVSRLTAKCEDLSNEVTMLRGANEGLVAQANALQAKVTSLEAAAKTAPVTTTPVATAPETTPDPAKASKPAKG